MEKCTATTKSGRPCNAWAIRGEKLCSTHSGRNMGAGAPAGNVNRLTHGFYGRQYTQQEATDLQQLGEGNNLNDEIALLRVANRRAYSYIALNPDIPAGEFVPLFEAISSNSRAIARLLRDQKALAGEVGDGLAEILGELERELQGL